MNVKHTTYDIDTDKPVIYTIKNKLYDIDNYFSTFL